MFADHVVELRDGGSALDLANGRCLCGSCHSKKRIGNRASRAGAGFKYSTNDRHKPHGGPTRRNFDFRNARKRLFSSHVPLSCKGFSARMAPERLIFVPFDTA
jgi:hypothetical protein